MSSSAPGPISDVDILRLFMDDCESGNSEIVLKTMSKCTVVAGTCQINDWLYHFTLACFPWFVGIQNDAMFYVLDYSNCFFEIMNVAINRKLIAFIVFQNKLMQSTRCWRVDRLVLFRFVSFRFVSFRFVSFRFVSFRFGSFRFVSFRSVFVLFCFSVDTYTCLP
jgi:hypothetical protein